MTSVNVKFGARILDSRALNNLHRNRGGGGGGWVPRSREGPRFGKIHLPRLRCRASTEGDKSKKKQAYRIMSRATQKIRSSSSCGPSCVDCLEDVPDIFPLKSYDKVRNLSKWCPFRL